MTQLFTNNATSALAATITSADTSITLALNDGAKFPAVTAGDDFLLTLFQRVGTTEQNHEIVRCTARSGDVLTVVRGQEGTTARAFGIGDFAELRLTAGAILPVRAGVLTGALNEAATVTIASAATIALGAAKANTATISGTTTITGFDTVAAGITRRTVFSGALTLTHNVSKLILIGSANIVTVAGDTAEWLSQGAGVWRMTNYTRANGDAVGTVSIAKGGTGATTDTAARANLGLGNVENKSSATIRGEITSADVATALGSAPVPASYLANRSTVDPNAISAQGGVSTNYLDPAASNRPAGTSHALLTLANSASLAAQIAADYSANEFYTRTESADVFSSWRKLLHNGDIIPLDKGGTGATTAAGALAAIGGVSSTDIANKLAEYGVGTTNAAPSIADIDDITVRSGMYYISGGTNTVGTFPVASLSGFLLHRVYGSAGFQMYQPLGSDNLYYRRRSASAWQAWVKLRNHNDVVAIAQGGTGATDAAGAKTALALNNVENKSSATIRGEITSANITGPLGFTPVQQGTGTSQLTNVVKIGWLTGSKLGLTVDVTDFGSNWPIGITGNAATATTASAVAWSAVTGKPTTISGFGITDAPTKTGSGASGSWGISITGNAATATSATSATTASGASSLQGMMATSNATVSSICSRDAQGDVAARVFWSYKFSYTANDNWDWYGASIAHYGVTIHSDRTFLCAYGAIMFGVNGERGYINTGGLYMHGDITAFSDESLKTNWRPVTDGFVGQWAGVKCGVYDRTDIELTQAGVSAQAVRRVLPEVVRDDGERLSLNYGAAATVATVELAKKAVDHEQQINDLTALVNSLVERIKELEPK